ncbi:hypothetical protein BS50DRAFT_579424 [Corynespora cassiicola Philippines]|uniref:Uncharacterized protein n=1 Tax=Corynespora cassiicola Philippines TaxID=1448308 RepID=A0A2T2N4D5_CORCC|nr:hypothetical protein BS50DRAFT_579424 [Corynespora cassiicola Philippines]
MQRPDVRAFAWCAEPLSFTCLGAAPPSTAQSSVLDTSQHLHPRKPSALRLSSPAPGNTDPAQQLPLLFRNRLGQPPPT